MPFFLVVSAVFGYQFAVALLFNTISKNARENK